LARARRLQELAEEIGTSEQRVLETKTKLAQLDSALTENTQAISDINQKLATLSAQKESLQSSLEKLQSESARIQQQIAQIDEKTSHDRTLMEILSQKRVGLSQDLSKIIESQNRNNERGNTLAEELSQMRLERDQAHTNLTEARLKEAQSRHNLEIQTENTRVLQSRLSELSGRQELIVNELARLQQDISNYQLQAKEKNELAGQLSQTLVELETSLSAIKAQMEEQEGLSLSAKSAREAIRSELNRIQESLMRANLEVSELGGRKSLLTEELSRRFGSDAAPATINWRAKLYEYDFFAKADEASLELAAVQMPSDEELLGRYATLNRDVIGTDCAALHQKLDSIGPVNESALEDYKIHESRYNTLKAQVDDLQAAKTELSTALIELEGQSATLFSSAFELIRGNFSRTFERLFGGGKADLLLENLADPLNSGIEIMARPPGTQLKSLGLLSGGQKTMTAVALLFAIYQVKPPPFCVLDELDAPLDDANIGRFLEMLRDFTAWSQFVIITHNRRTMASAAVLYGVTMKERGVSRIISMRLSQAQEFSKNEAKQEPKEAPALIAESAPSNVEEKTDQVAEAVSGYSLDTLKEKVAAALEEENETGKQSAPLSAQ